MDALIDSCVLHEWPNTEALVKYMPRAWREVILRPRRGPGRPAMSLLTKARYSNPIGEQPESARPATGPAGSDRDILVRELLDGTGRERVVLSYGDGLLATAFPNAHIATQTMQAANRWTEEEWLAGDDRLHGLIMISMAAPLAAADEIRRAGRNPAMVGVLMGSNVLALPFGHQVYQPIFASAVEMGLPLVMQVGGEMSADLLVSPTAGGMPSTYAEYRVMAAQPLATHAANMIVQGVFNEFPELKVLLVGSGAAWLSAFLWRLDYWYHVEEVAAPWLRKLPSEYFREHFRVATHSMEAPTDPSRLVQALETVPGIDELLMYASCYPNSDAETPEQTAALLPQAWHDRVFSRNARGFYRWASPTTPSDSRLAPKAPKQEVTT